MNDVCCSAKHPTVNRPQTRTEAVHSSTSDRNNTLLAKQPTTENVMKRTLILAATSLVASLIQAGPIPSGQLTLAGVYDPAVWLGITENSMYNCRYFGTKVYANQINDPCFGRYEKGFYTPPEVAVNNTGDHTYEHRMVTGFPGANSSTYMLGSSSGNIVNGVPYTTTTFTRYSWDGTIPVMIDAPGSLRFDTFDWVDDDTIIAVPGTNPRNRIFLLDVTADPFSMTTNTTTWNTNGCVTNTLVSSIRNVRVGHVYSGYAYYGEDATGSPKIYALNLATGNSTLLGNLGVLSGGGGINAVVERGGYLFLLTAGDGLFVYNMTDATTLGSLYTSYSKSELDTATGYDPNGTQYYGFDVSPDLNTFILGAAWGHVYELAPTFRLGIVKSGTQVTLTWPSYYSQVMVQSSSDLSAGFTDMSPQPTVQVNGNVSSADIPMGTGPTFFRLNK
jgi:hypothetical protein